MPQNTKAQERINQSNSHACKHVGSGESRKGKIGYSLKTYMAFGSPRSTFLKLQNLEVFQAKNFPITPFPLKYI